MKKKTFKASSLILSLASIAVFTASSTNAAVTLESSTKIADNALHFDGYDLDSSAFKNLNLTTQQQKDDARYHYKFGGSISAHGDSVKIYKHYVFMTWYQGGKDNRHVMLSRLNTKTGSVKTIEFPHQHTGFQGRWWQGESHNTIGLTISPKNGTIHMVYDMHAYGDCSVPTSKYCDAELYPDEPFKNDFFRYSYSVAGAAEVTDDDFTLENIFVKDTSDISQGPDDYKHLVMTKNLDDRLNFAEFTYPKFFETKEGDLLHFMRWGGNNNGAYYYNRYDAIAEKWSKFVPFNHKNQKSHGLAHNWGLYGEMKYVNGKLRVGFQRRSSNNSDKFIYQNGIYYAYLDDPANNVWRDHTGKQITWPLADADEIKIFEPGDLVETTSTAANGSGTPPGKVHIVGNFDWTVTDKGDLHFIHRVADKEFNRTIYGHLYKPAGATEFIHAPGIPGSSEINAIGDDVYIIGLKDKKPYIQVAKGGTTEFKEIYRDTTTTTDFDHGVSYAKNGKVYYYLMEKPSSGLTTANPIHLQIIDLGLPQTTVEFEQSELTVVEGYQTLAINATPSILDSNRSIASVALYIDDEAVSTLGDLDSYTWAQDEAKLQNLAMGTYTLKAVVTDDQGMTTEAMMTLNVVDPTPTVAFAESAITLAKGYSAIDVSVTAQTPDVLRTITGVSLYLDDQLVSEDTSAPYQWTNTSSELLGLDVGVYTLKAVVTDSKGDTAETSIQLNVIDPTPIVSFPAGDISVEEGYTSLSVNVAASTPVEGRTIQQVELLVNDSPVRTESVAPYDWGHNEANAAELLGFPIGVHTVKAIVTDSEGLTAEATVQLTVTEKVVAPVIRFTQGTQTLLVGYSDLSLAVEASTAMTTRTIKQVAFSINSANAEVVTVNNSGVYEWSSSALQGLDAGTYTVKAVVTDSADLTSEATAIITVKEPLPPQVAFAQSSMSKTEGYSSISITVNATSPDGNNMTSVKLYLNDVEVDEKTSAPFTFTQSTSALADLAPGSYTLKAVAIDDRGLSSETTASVTVAAKPKEPESSGGGGSTGLFWLAGLSLMALRRRCTLTKG